MERLPVVVMCRTDGVGVAIAVGHMTVRTMLGIHPPWTLVAAMIHRWRLGLVVSTDTGPGTLRLWHSSRLGSGWRPVGCDIVLGNVHRRRTAGAMRTLTG